MVEFVEVEVLKTFEDMVAGLGLRSPVKQDYEPCKILTFHPHVFGVSFQLYQTEAKIDKIGILDDPSVGSRV